MQPAQVGIYLNRQALPAADQALLRDAFSWLVTRGEYSRLVRQYYAEPRWSMLGLDARLFPPRQTLMRCGPTTNGRPLFHCLKRRQGVVTKREIPGGDAVYTGNSQWQQSPTGAHPK